MRRIISASILALIIMVLCPLTIVAQTEPGRNAEVEVREVINRWGKLWNENNQSALLDMYHPDAKIVYGWGNQKGTANKKEYENILPQRIKANPSLELTIKNLDVQGEKATVLMEMKTKGGVTPVTFELLRGNGKWLITGFKY